MTTPRNWNRREFSITQNGYFTILKSAGWFSAAPLPDGFRYRLGQSPKTAFPRANGPDQASNQPSTIRLQTIDSTMPERRFMRPALIVLAATALTWIGLWCTSHP
jgi:hypothetical protein